MSMNATSGAASEPAIRRATVDFPDPEPPAIPTINDTGPPARKAPVEPACHGSISGACELSRFGIGD